MTQRRTRPVQYREPDHRLGSKRNGTYILTADFRTDPDTIRQVQECSALQVFTQRELAEMFGISVPTVSKIQRIQMRRAK